MPAFIEGSSKTVHKVSRLFELSLPSNAGQLAKLEYLAGYFDTDTQNMSGLSYETAVERFSSMVSCFHLRTITWFMTGSLRLRGKGLLKITNSS